MGKKKILLSMYEAMHEAFGPMHWWPAKSDFEVMVGAILTQNTNWKNVEKAIANLQNAKALTPQAIHDLASGALAELIRPSGYYNVKALRLKNLVAFLQKHYSFNLQKMAEEDVEVLRSGLLGVQGIGPETADSILLYALHKPVFVVDAYTFRILNRHGLMHEDATYYDMQHFFMDALEPDVPLFNAFHAFLVRVGSRFCKKREPLCATCPLSPYLNL